MLGDIGNTKGTRLYLAKRGSEVITLLLYFLAGNFWTAEN